MPSSTLPATARAAAGHLFLQQHRTVKAEAAFDEALRMLDEDGGGAPLPSALRLLRGEWLAGWAYSARENGRARQASSRLHEELQAWAPLEGAAWGADLTEAALVRATLEYELASCLLVVLESQPAVRHIHAALERLPASGAETLRARLQAVHGRALGLANEREAAMRLLEQALAVLDQSQHRAWQLEAADLRGVLGAMQGFLGLLDLAEANFTRAETLLAGLAAAGCLGAWGRLGRLRMNRGAICSITGHLQDGVTWERSALSALDAAIRRSPPGTDLSRLRVTKLIARMNLGHSLYQIGRDEEAGRHLRCACRLAARLVRTQPHVQVQQQRCRVNLAHVLVRQGRLQAATRLYAQGLAAFAAAVAAGQTNLMSDRANAALCLARVLLLRGREGQACELFLDTMSEMAEQTRSGHLFNAVGWLLGWQQQMDAALQARDGDGAPGEVALGALARALDQAPPQGLGPADRAPATLLQAVRQLAGWVDDAGWCTQRPSPLASVLQAFLRYLLACTSDVLADFEPARLQAHAAALQEAVDGLREVAGRLPDAPRLLADWFLHTRGLRAQRNALAAGSDPDLLVLRERMARLRQVEDELLGAVRSAVPAVPLQPSPGAATADANGTPEPVVAVWRRLHDEVRSLRDLAVARRLLPAALRLDAAAAVAGLAPTSALLMMAPAPGRLLVLALRGGRAPALQAACALPAAAASFSPRLLNALAGQALGAACAGRALRTAAPTRRGDDDPAADIDPDADRFVLSVVQDMWSSAVLPVVERLAADGVGDVCLVPGDDLHLLPWSHFAATALPDGMRMEIYPSAGAWARCRLKALPGDDAAAPAAGPRWALAAWAALDSARPLPWVQVESAMARELWQPAADTGWIRLHGAAPQVDGVDAFLGIGHGATPGDNPARAGLGLEGGEVLTGHDLQRVRSCRHVLLSACVLGITDEVFGEALGFLSSCFDYSTGFGNGWLTEVPDAEACLVSLALQFALKQAPADRPWSDTVRELRRTIADGAWPPGLGAWLRDRLPAAAASQGVRWTAEMAPARDTGTWQAPPASLQRLMPWMVALGR